MMSWELPLTEMKGMRRSPLALGSPAGAPREKAADPAAQPRPGKACFPEPAEQRGPRLTKERVAWETGGQLRTCR